MNTWRFLFVVHTRMEARLEVLEREIEELMDSVEEDCVQARRDRLIQETQLQKIKEMIEGLTRHLHREGSLLDAAM